jgi:hypothetical protein
LHKCDVSEGCKKGMSDEHHRTQIDINKTGLNEVLLQNSIAVSCTHDNEPTTTDIHVWIISGIQLKTNQT